MRIFDHRDRRRGRPQRLQQRPRQREPIGPVRRSTGSRHRREQLEHRAERDRHRQRLARADRKCRPAPQPGPQRPHQRRLTDPRLTRDQHERSRSRARRLDRLNQRYEFGLSLEQWLHRHPIVIPPRPDSGALAITGFRQSGGRRRRKRPMAQRNARRDTNARLDLRGARDPVFATSRAGRTVCGD